ncbi:MAG: Flp family type IVb pilin [Pseudomonadota bacterium]|nr:Flp family type IVb pilin [Pseudomonadota bacterium]
MHRLRRLLTDDSGATAVEYALILALIFLAMIAGVQNFATTTTEMWNNVAETVAGS